MKRIFSTLIGSQSSKFRNLSSNLAVLVGRLGNYLDPMRKSVVLQNFMKI
ncbi:hypothetical protein HMPREF1139_1114 [Campylobacter sp. FOBRC14]|nr:hypothetical protein HMPREF1139_1114 [Campylobacter sp. FOBRC14]